MRMTRTTARIIRPETRNESLAALERLERRISILSLQRYRWLCVLGGEVAYALCLAGGFFPLRSPAGTQLHHALFETLPGFVWINASSALPGAVYVFAFTWIFGSYIVWMHNSSLIKAVSEHPRKAA